MAGANPGREMIARSCGGLAAMTATLAQFVARAVQLYGQEPGEALASARLGLYVRRWVWWAGAGLNTPAGIWH
jgi:hypothetical protein